MYFIHFSCTCHYAISAQDLFGGIMTLHKLKYLFLGWGAVLLCGGCGPAEFMGLKAKDLFPDIADNQKLREPHVLTTVGQLGAAISPDGENVIYVSGEQGNLDIYRRPVKDGPGVRLTDQTADDLEPAFSPDGRLLAYVSMEEDAKGDIWLMRADGKNKKRLTGRETGDRSPVFSPDGQYIYYVSRQGVRGQPVIYRISLHGGSPEALITGFDPAPLSDGRHLIFTAFDERNVPRLQLIDLTEKDPTPVHLTDGAFFEGFSHVFANKNGGDRVIFNRFCDDTNGDGILDGGDAPSLWRLDLTVGDGWQVIGYYPLTTGDQAEIFGSLGYNLLFFTSGDQQTAVLPGDGIVPRNMSTATLQKLAQSADNDGLRRMLLRYLISRGGTAVGMARYELARALAEEGKYPAAIDELTVALEVVTEPTQKELLALEKFRLETLSQVAELPNKKEYLQSRLALMAKLFTANEELPAVVRANRLAVRAELSFAAGMRESLPQLLDEIIRMPEAPLPTIAKAQRILADLAWQLQRRDEARAMEVATLKLRAPLRVFKNEAVDRLLAEQPEDIDRATYLQSLVGENIPLLAGRALLELGRHYRQQGQPQLAMEVFSLIVEKYPLLNRDAAQALLLLAELAEESGQSTRALDYLERIISSYGSEKEAVSTARKILGGSSLARVLLMEQQGNYQSAYENFQHLIHTDSGSITAHRHFIKLGAKLGKLPEVLEYYQQRLLESPRTTINLYGYGLALTYLGPASYQKAAVYLDQALQNEPHLAEALLTRGWLEEQDNRHDSYGQHLEKAVDYYNGALTAATNEEITAAANLNLGHGFFMMGKDDLAFASYLARELSAVPFESLEQELLFRERFGRVAQRLEYHEEALTSLNDAEQLSSNGSYPRRGEILLLLGMVWYDLEEYSEAARWYAAAAEFFGSMPHERHKQLVAWRAGSYALEAAGDYIGAEKAVRSALDLLAGTGGPESHKYDLLEFELALEEGNVTRAPYGFDGAGERELLVHNLSALNFRQGRITAAAEYFREKIQLLEKARKNRHIGEAVTGDLYAAYNELGRLLAWSGDNDGAFASFNKARQLELAEPPLLAIVNILDLTGYGFQLNPVLRQELAAAWPAVTEMCQQEKQRRFCLSGALSLAAVEMAALNLTRPRGELDINGLINKLDSDGRQINAISGYLGQASQLAATADEKGAVQALNAQLLALTGDKAEAGELLTAALQGVSPALAWRLHLARYELSGKQDKGALVAAIAALREAAPSLKRTALFSPELKALLLTAFADLPAENNGPLLLELVDIWRSLQLATAYRPVESRQFAAQLGPATYLFQQRLEEVELLLLVKGNNYYSFSGEAVLAAGWLKENLPSDGVLYLDSLEETTRRPVAGPGEKGIFLIPRPGLLQKALAGRTFSTRADRVLTTEDYLANDLTALSNMTASCSSVRVDVPLISGPEGLPLIDAADGSRLPFKNPAWHTPRLVFSQVQLPPAAAENVQPANIFQADNTQLAQARLIAAAMEQGATLIEVNNVLAGAAPLDKAGEQLAAASQLKKATASAVTFYQRRIWSEAIAAFNLTLEATEYLGRPTVVVHSRLLDSYLNNQQPEKAIPKAQTIRQYYQDHGQVKEAAASGLTLAIIYYQQKDYPAAAAMFTTVAGEYLQCGQFLAAADSYSRAGTALAADGNYTAALENYRRAQQITLEAGAPLDLAVERLIGVTLESRLNEYAAALKVFETLLSAARESGDLVLIHTARLDIIRTHRELGNYALALQLGGDLAKELAGGDNNLLAQTKLEIARIHWYRGEYRQALATADEALALAHLLSDHYLEIQGYSLKGLIQRNKGELETAEQSLRQALQLAQSTGRTAEVASQMNNLGIVLREKGMVAASIDTFNQALELDKKSNNKEGIAYDLRNLAISQIVGMAYREAEKNLLTAMEISKKLAFRYNELECIYALAELQEKTGRPAAAQESYRQAAELAEALSSKEIKWHILYNLGLLANKNGDRQEARTLLYQAVGQAEELGLVTNEERSPSKQQLYGTLITILLEDGEPEPAFLLLNRYRQLATAGRVTVDQNIDFAALRLSERSALVAAFPAGKQLALWWWEPDAGLKGTLRPLPDNNGRQLLATLEQRLVNFMPVDELLAQIGDLLLSPLGTRLQEIDRLGFVLTGEWAKLPLAALSYQGQSLADRGIASFQLPDMSIPMVSSVNENGLLLAGYGSSVTPYAALEVAALAAEHRNQLAGPIGWVPRQQGIATAGILHLAGHLTLDRQNSLDSAIEVSPNQAITIGELLAVPALPPTLVLSSCRFDEGDGNIFQGVSRALLHKGVNNIVATNMRVADLTTALLMKYFYRYYLNGNEGAATALLHAQREVRKNYPHPAYWATFTVNGSP